MLTWTHQKCSHADCTEDTECPNFPTVQDKINMTSACYQEYDESEDSPCGCGVNMQNFFMDVVLFMRANGYRESLPRMLKQANDEFKRSGVKARV